MQLVLSMFPGADLLGRGFEEEGFCVVRGPDIVYGSDIRTFHGVKGKFDGVIGGPPCQDFSALRRGPETGYGVEMLREFLRVVSECSPAWFLMENVARVPDVSLDGYHVQRFDLNARHCGSAQSRLRHWQFGSLDGSVLQPVRCDSSIGGEAICVASEGARSGRRGWSEFCQLQGLPADFELPGLSVEASYRAVGNGVPLPMARTVARAVTDRSVLFAGASLCGCGCGRSVTGRQLLALPACRQRVSRLSRGVTRRRLVAPAGSQ